MRAGSTQPTAAQVAARLEDCRWMAETGECLTGAARRLGLAHKTLEKWLMKNDRPTLAVLIARQPRDHNRFVDGFPIGQITGQTARRKVTKDRARTRQEAA